MVESNSQLAINLLDALLCIIASFSLVSHIHRFKAQDASMECSHIPGS